MSTRNGSDGEQDKDRQRFGLTRRGFLKATGAAGAVYWLGPTLMLGDKVYAQIPGGTLSPTIVPKYQEPLLIPPVMPKSATLKEPGGKNIDYYEISVKQFQQQILPTGFPATTVWGYGAVDSKSKNGLLLHNTPAMTIEAMRDTPVRIKWINDLVDSSGDYLPHLLPVDPTLHWANPPGGTTGRDTQPTFATTPARYTGPVPIVTHVHGAVGVGDESDGYTEAWYLPAAGNTPSGYATEGTWYDFFSAKAASDYGADWGPGYAVFQYPNENRASTIWYHDHALGITRLNVYAGLAGFYILRGKGSDVIDSRTGMEGVLPGPCPREGDKFPSNKAYYEIPIVIQDRSFNDDGSLFYPNSREFFDGISGAYLPNSDVSPIWNPEFFGNMMMVNGKTWPFQSVEQRRYRFRFLNGCQSRFLILDFNAIPGVRVWQIGNEGGYLPAPVDLTTLTGNRLTLALAERADLIVDFTNVPTGNYVLNNVGPDEPFGGGQPGTDFTPADPDSTGQILQFRVVPAVGADPTTPPEALVLPPVPALPATSTVRRLALVELESTSFAEAPVEALLGTVQGDPSVGPATWMKHFWDDPLTENPGVGDTEIWEFYNTTGDAHPIHVHEVVFEVIDRQPLIVDGAAQTVQLTGTARQPEPWESGFKDMVTAYPGEVTRIRVRFDKPGRFVYHCHIIEHEDHEMMRPLQIGPTQSGQPD